MLRLSCQPVSHSLMPAPAATAGGCLGLEGKACERDETAGNYELPITGAVPTIMPHQLFIDVKPDSGP